ncbi:MAG: D-alanyl-D-alanine carboxypeptidase/D-alanyl-D-alanine-endopeptidase, partial [Myxococcota bacterium]|nr:D-alanyl-D-alanine carboxypeptidase/D-alanyl-D-alanine-endopeptidase [Myxococcota bacterium]
MLTSILITFLLTGPVALGSGEVGLPASPLDDVLAPIVEESQLKGASLAVQVVNVRTGEEVYGLNADESLVPASVMKVLTAATALRTLGPAYRFSTLVYTDGELDNEGVLHGNLYIKGFGDPSFVIERLWKLVFDLHLEGLERVEGDLIFDGSFYDDDHLIAGWRKAVDLENGPSYFAPIGALSLNFNTTVLLVSPGSEVGEPAVVRQETPAGIVTIDNGLETGKTGSRKWIRLDRKANHEGGEVTLTLRGSIPLDAETSRYRKAVSKPTPHFMSAFEGQLEAQGIKVTGRSREGGVPAGAEVIAESWSDSLGVLLTTMN